jgi:Zn-dependent M28 family amino/carboxypeptidase
MTLQPTDLPPSRDERQLHRRLERHVSVLAEDIGERNIWTYRKLIEAADYVDQSLVDAGCNVMRQEFDVQGHTVANLECCLGHSKSSEIVVVGAHYDTVMGSPGANDNGTGVAALIEIARILQGARLNRTVRIVAFVNEEPPFFKTAAMGSQQYAKRERERGEDIVAMLSLETIGYYSNEPGSQRYPFPLRFFYPRTASFIGFVSNLSSRKLVKRTIQAFRAHSDFPAQYAAVPSWLTGIGWSDHASFWAEGYPAIMVTDTAFFRYAHYHTAEDTPDKIDYDSLARVTMGLAHVVEELAM